MSRKSTPTVSGLRARVASYIGRLMPEISAADNAKVTASNPSSQAGSRIASSAPTAAGTAISTTLATLHTTELASAIRPRPTRTGTAPKTAPSKNTPMLGPTKATANTCGTVTSPSHAASGIVARTTVFRRSAATMTFCRFQRSVRAPEKRPKIR